MPSFDELEYRRKLLDDEETMSYNIGYGYNKETGCIKFNQERWQDWYSKWIDNIPEKYYAYIIKVDDNIPIGEVALRYESEKQAYCINIIIEAKYRGNKFSQEALKLLLNVAFEQLGANKVFDDFLESRKSAEKAFEKLGFKRISDNIIELTREDYFDNINE